MDQAQKIFRINLGKRIEQERVKNGMDQSTLAAIIGRDKQFINRYERNGANPTAYILSQLSSALKITPNDLLDFKKLDI